jgi:monoamine oxidase
VRVLDLQVIVIGVGLAGLTAAALRLNQAAFAANVLQGSSLGSVAE